MGAGFIGSIKRKLIYSFWILIYIYIGSGVILRHNALRNHK